MGWLEYNKIKKIGEGSFGSAWLVKNIKNTQSYVIKQINVSRMPLKEREEARKEVSVLAQMKHPNIVSYIDSFEELGNLCIVMDYCDGGDLYNKIHTMRGVPISEEQILDWFVQITLALKHVHDRKILHRDLKSQNIFLTKDGIIKLGDFGVAKVLGNTMEFARTAIGTPYYMSPEICERKPYNNKSDVWSLGCILYEMTNMKHPFEANNMHMLIVKILKANFEQVNPRYSYELRNLVACMLKRNPRERPSVNGILRKAFVMRRCEKFLTNDKLIEEFSHTVLHGENFKNKINNPVLARPNSAVNGLRQVPNPTPRPGSAAVAAKPVIISNNQAVQPKIGAYDPAKIYKNPVVRRETPLVQKSSEKKIVTEYPIKKRAPSAGVNRAPSVERESNVDSPIDRKSYLELQKQKRAFEEAIFKKKHQELLDKQKMERLRKAREEGWKNVLEGSLQNKKEDNSSSENDSPPIVPQKPNYPLSNVERAGLNEPKVNNIYTKYHQQLDDFEEKKKIVIEKQELISKANKMNNMTPRAINNIINSKPVIKKSPLANDFAKRKEEFARNKARGRGVLNPLIPKPPSVKRDENSDYEEKLRRIRLQNYNNRRILINYDKKKSSIDLSLDNNNRLKRINALRQQSEEQQQRLKERLEMEKKRHAAYEKEKQYNIDRKIDQKPAPAVNITDVFKDIGVVGKQISKAEVLQDLNEKIYQNESVLSARNKKWKDGTDLTSLNDKTLVNDQTIKTNKNEEILSPRKNWDLPHETVIKALELADISSTNPALFEATLKPSNKSNFKRCETFLIEKNKIHEKSLSNSNDLNKEKPPSILNNLGILEKTNKDIINTLLNNEKLATLGATKNLLLGITLGKYDPKSTKMLRTCSEPDMTKLFHDEILDRDNNNMNNKAQNDNQKSTEESQFKKTFNDDRNKNNEKQFGTLRLARSLEDGLDDNKDDRINSEEENIESSSSPDEDKELIELVNSKFNFEDKNEIEDDDVVDVRKTMENILNDNDTDSEKLSDTRSFKKSKKQSDEIAKKKGVCFASANKLVSQLSVSKFSETPFDSLDINRKSQILNDDLDCDNLSLTGEEEDDEDSDTEFEDDSKIQMDDTVKVVSAVASSYHSIEEKRAKLEKILGTKKFIEGYPTIQNLVLSEREDTSFKTKKLEDRRSYVSFLKYFPSSNVNLYNDMYNLIIADHEFNEN